MSPIIRQSCLTNGHHGDQESATDLRLAHRVTAHHLLAAGIQPTPTLFHWDLPAALDERGGWRNRDSASWFAAYAEVVFHRLADRVTRWTTLNEPWVVVDGGYVHGVHPPGKRDLDAAPLATHNLLRAHGLAVQCFRAQGHGEIGIVVNVEPKDSASEDPADLAATRLADAYMNRQYLDPLMLGRYPEEMSEIFGDHWPDFPPGDFALISQPVDFLGLNYYTRSVNRHDPAAHPVCASVVKQPGAVYTELDWEVHPQSLREVLLWLKSRYGNPAITITENGAAFIDPPADSRGHIKDTPRIAYLRSHLLAMREAMDAGVDVRGYFAWSLLDNLEWTFGHTKRFGLIGVDFGTQERVLKDSALFYRDVIASNGAILNETTER